MNDSSRGIAAACALAIVLGGLTGCSVVGFRYTYRGQQYTMTRPNIDHHQAAIQDVRTRFGDPDWVRLFRGEVGNQGDRSLDPLEPWLGRGRGSGILPSS